MKNGTTSADISYDKLFARLSDVSCPADLEQTIVHTIYVKETHAAEVRFAFLGTLSVASVAGLVTSSIYISHDVARSGFEQYLMLSFSDSSVLLIYWKQFALSLIETLPLVGVVAFLSALGLFIWSAAKAAANGFRVFAKMA